MSVDCPFCNLASRIVIGEFGSMVAIEDGFAISPGHTLIVPKRHVASFFELSEAERADLLVLVGQITAMLGPTQEPAGYNIGFNEGAAAGQTVMHFHLHVIPRYENDVPDPRGGIRWILPEKAIYWEEEE